MSIMATLKSILIKVYKRLYPILIPYKIYNNIYCKRKHIFEAKYMDYCKRGNQPLMRMNANAFQTIVSVQGFGFSGSGAVLDLLCEIDACEVVGTDVNIKSKEDHNGVESDFLRMAGGVFEFERFLDSKNVFQKDALIKRFINYVESSNLFKSNYEVQQLFLQFFDSIIELKILGLPRGAAYNKFLYGDRARNSIFFLKPLTKDVFRKIAGTFLNDLFNIFNINNKRILVFDQLLCDMELDMKMYKAYIPSCKLITVYRDPRDVYAYAYEHEVSWIAHNTVEEFICWYRIMTETLKLDTEDYLVVQFENLVNDYEDEIIRIFNYINVGIENHCPSLKRTFFDPDFSRKNIGVWKQSSLPQSDFLMIEKALAPFCYSK